MSLKNIHIVFFVDHQIVSQPFRFLSSCAMANQMLCQKYTGTQSVSIVCKHLEWSNLSCRQYYQRKIKWFLKSWMIPIVGIVSETEKIVDYLKMVIPGILRILRMQCENNIMFKQFRHPNFTVVSHWLRKFNEWTNINDIDPQQALSRWLSTN